MVDIQKIFNRARVEMFLPALKFSYEIKGNTSFKTSIKQASVSVTIPRELLERSDAEEILLWSFRHILAHVHYCPYDIKTARELEELVRKELRGTPLLEHAHSILWLFADLQIDLVYLPMNFSPSPHHLKYIYRKEPRGMELLKYSVYRVVYEDFVPEYEVDPLVSSYARYVAKTILTPRPWNSKIVMLTRIIKRFLNVRSLDMNKLTFMETHLPLKEDVKNDGSSGLLKAGALISDESEARSFFREWVAPRLKEQINDLFRRTNEVLKKGKEVSKESLMEKLRSLLSGTPLDESGKEPVLRTRMSKPMTHMSRKQFMESLWRCFWYKAIAEDTVMKFMMKRGLPRPTWTILSYPDEWTAEDDIEELDIEGSAEEGPLIPEVTTIRWIRRGSLSGHELSLRFAPSVMVVLDSSRSMMSSFNNAAIAAFIAYLSAKKAGGRTSVIVFSTKYLLGDWDAADDVKEILLSTRLGEYTILPTHVMLHLVTRLSEPVFIIIITDGGWQNFDEAISDLKKIAEMGHEIVILHLYGWKYPEKVSRLSSLDFIRFYHIDDPKELKNIALEESYQKYGLFLVPHYKFQPY